MDTQRISFGIAGFCALSTAKYYKEHQRRQRFGIWIPFLSQVTEGDTYYTGSLRKS
jgi:hypothetical protein